MSDFSALNKLIKQAAIDAMKNSAPSDFENGTVLSASPIQIKIEQKMTLGAAQLQLTRNVTDYEIEVTVDWTSETNDVIKGKKKITIHNALKKGDKVILAKCAGGQRYIVLDKVV